MTEAKVETTVVGMVSIPRWRYVWRDGAVDAEGLTLTHPVDVFLVMGDGRLVPVAYDPARGTVYLEEEPGVVMLQTGLAQVSWAEHFGNP